MNFDGSSSKAQHPVFDLVAAGLRVQFAFQCLRVDHPDKGHTEFQLVTDSLVDPERTIIRGKNLDSQKWRSFDHWSRCFRSLHDAQIRNHVLAGADPHPYL